MGVTKLPEGVGGLRLGGDPPVQGGRGANPGCGDGAGDSMVSRLPHLELNPLLQRLLQELVRLRERPLALTAVAGQE
jgi:hypothetical protein